MVARTTTVAFQGVDAARVDVEVQVSGGQPFFGIVGLADKAVAESRERVRAAFSAIGLALPPKRLLVNLAPADLPKEGAHYDLPIALGLMAALGVLPADAIADRLILGELGLDGSIRAVSGTLPAAMAAVEADLGLICPRDCGPEAAWAGDNLDILAPPHLFALLNHIRGEQLLAAPQPGPLQEGGRGPDLRDVRGQETAKRALEIAAAGGHNLLLVGPPGAGKSMLAERLPGLLPPLDSRELLDVARIHSVAGLLERGALSRQRPFRAPHHSASMAALTGGGPRAKPGEASLAHGGVLFLDELPEFSGAVLDSLRQPLETGTISVSRAAHRFTYPAAFQLIAAMNPCRCGGAGGADGLACRRGPSCAAQYQARISGPLLDRIDIRLDIPAVTPSDLALPPSEEGTRDVAARVAAARDLQRTRRETAFAGEGPATNARLTATQIETVSELQDDARQLLLQAAEKMGLTARGYHRVMKLARTIADLEASTATHRVHVSEALSLRARSLDTGMDGANNGRARASMEGILGK